MKIKTLSAGLLTKNKVFIQRYHKVAIAVSGGVDSIALLHVFYEWSKKNFFSDLVILHVNFGLRSTESDLDEAFVCGVANRLGIAYECLNIKEKSASASWTDKRKGESTQVWARRVRHTWFGQYARKGFQIALGHTADDVAETMLMRLARGSSLAKLAGMSFCDGSLWRPLVTTLKADLRQSLEESGLNWREDSSNKKTIYTRNRVRLQILPRLEELYPGATLRMALAGLDGLPSHSDKLPEVAGKDAFDVMSLISKLQPSREKLRGVEQFCRNAKVGASLDLGRGYKLVKTSEGDKFLPEILHIRARQHVQSLDARDFEVIVPANTRFLVGQDSALRPLSLRPSAANVGLVRICRPKSEDKVRIAGSKVAFKFKDLMQKWKMPVNDRAAFFVVYDEDNLGVLKSTQFPDTDADE